MANYIKTLQAEERAARQQVAIAMQALADFRVFLNSSKFQTQSNGERGDWIATSDVIRWIEQVRTDIINGE